MFQTFHSSRSLEIAIESCINVLRSIKISTDVLPGASRGNHGYHQTKQVLICLSREIKVKCIEDGAVVVYQLKDNKTGLYLEPQVCREAYDLSEDAVLLVLTSRLYDEGDYLR